MPRVLGQALVHAIKTDYEAGVIPIEAYQRTLHHTLGIQQMAKRRKPNQPRPKPAKPRPAKAEDQLE